MAAFTSSFVGQAVVHKVAAEKVRLAGGVRGARRALSVVVRPEEGFGPAFAAVLRRR
jgi:hypothetical protein